MSEDSVIELVMTDTIVSKETQEKILKYMKDICKTESKKISYCPLLFTSVDGSEVYDGESIFGRSKFVTKYKYEIDNILDVLEKLHETQNELTSTIFIKQIPNSIYKK